MALNDHVVTSELEHVAGKRIAKIIRVYYVHRDTVDKSDGDLELVYSDGTITRLSANAARKDPLVVEHVLWDDPFAPPLSVENEEFVKKSGKWARFDETDNSPYSDSIGRE